MTTISASAAEWIKLRSLRSTWWFLGGGLAVVTLLAVLAADDHDPTTVQSLGVAAQAVVNFAQYIFAGMAIVAMTGEFASRSISVTFACTPKRWQVMVAKAAVVGVVVGLVGTLSVAAGVLLAGARFSELGQLGGEEVLDVVLIGGYLAMLALIALGIGTVVRRTAGGLTLVLLLLLVLPEVLRMLSTRFEVEALAVVGDHTPGPAGYRFMAGEWEAGLVLAAWAVASLLAGTWALLARDA